MLFQSRQRQRSRLLRAALVSLSPKISAWIPAGKALAQVKAASEANRRAKAALRQDPSSERLRAEAETAQTSFREQFQHAASLGACCGRLEPRRGAGTSLLPAPAVAKVVALCLTTAAADAIVRVAVGAAMRSARVPGDDGGSGERRGLSAAEREALISQVLDQWLEDGAERLCRHVVSVVHRDGIRFGEAAQRTAFTARAAPNPLPPDPLCRHGLDATVSAAEMEDLVRTLSSSTRLASSTGDSLADTLLPSSEPELRARVIRAAAEASARGGGEEEEEEGGAKPVEEVALTAVLDETLDILER